MFGIVGYGNAPAESCTADAQILQTLFDEIDHFIAAGDRLNEIGVFIDVAEQTFGVVVKFEEITFFFDDVDLATAIGANTAGVFDLSLCKEGLAGYAVMTFIGAEIDVAFVFQLAEYLLNDFLVTGLSCSDEIAVIDIEFTPKLPEGLDDPVDVTDARFFDRVRRNLSENRRRNRASFYSASSYPRRRWYSSDRYAVSRWDNRSGS